MNDIERIETTTWMNPVSKEKLSKIYVQFCSVLGINTHKKIGA
jgi:hypothetical protein